MDSIILIVMLVVAFLSLRAIYKLVLGLSLRDTLEKRKKDLEAAIEKYNEDPQTASRVFVFLVMIALAISAGLFICSVSYIFSLI